MDKIQEAVEKIKSGKKDEGRRILVQILRSDPKNEWAWLWLAVAVEDPDKREECLERVLRINPNNQQAAKMMDKIRGKEPRSLHQLVQVWMNFFKMTEKYLKKEVQRANNQDTITCILVYMLLNIVLILVAGFFQIRMMPSFFGELFPMSGWILLILVIASIVMTPISFYLSVGIQNLGARLLGGKGTFSALAYLQALILVPLTAVSGLNSLAVLVPYIRYAFAIAGFGLSIYGIVLNVRAIKVVHNLTTGRAVGAIFLVPVIFVVLSACILFATGPILGQLFNFFLP